MPRYSRHSVCDASNILESSIPFMNWDSIKSWREYQRVKVLSHKYQIYVIQTKSPQTKSNGHVIPDPDPSKLVKKIVYLSDSEHLWYPTSVQ